MDVKYINPFVNAIRNVFETMVATNVKIGKPALQSNSDHTPDVSSVIGFSGDAVGSVVLSFPMDVACKLASKFAGVDLDENHTDFADAVGELANMVAGNAKANVQNMNMSISLPSVIVGRDHIVSQSQHTPHISFPCSTAEGDFVVNVSMKEAKKTAPSQGAAMAGAK